METGEDVSDNALKGPVINFKTVGPVTITYKVYMAIWSLQKYFNNPSVLFEEPEWLKFEKYTETVIGLFTDYHIDYQAHHHTTPGDSTFPKYLTSEQLCHLQIKDPQFRRQIVLQYMILLQYIERPPRKGQLAGARASLRMNRWIQGMQKKLENLLVLMSRKEFCEQLMSHEAGWNSWKDNSCPSLSVPNISGVRAWGLK